MLFSSSKSAIGLMVPLLLAMPSLAAAKTSLSGLYACAAVTNKEAQLACFLRETAKLREGDTPAAPKSVTPPPPPPLPAVIQKPASLQPRFEPLTSDKPKAPTSQTVAIQSTSKTARGYVRFTLENGEVWQQIEGGRVRLGTGSPDMLTIKRRSLGGLHARVNGKRPSIRVRRIK